MAKRRNKAAKVRETLAELGAKAKAKDVVEALAARRIRVSPQQVYNIMSEEGKPKKARSKGNEYDILVQAKKLADSLGGIDQARSALDALARLM